MSATVLILAALGSAQAWTKPYENVKLPKTPQELTSDLPAAGEGRIWLEGDVLKAVYHSTGPVDFVNLEGGLQDPLVRFEGTDYWGAQFRYRWWKKAVIGYDFLVQPKPKAFALKFKVWRGEEAPAAPAKAEDLKGTLTEKLFSLPWMSEKRTVRVYVPPDSPANVPFIVMADGQNTETYARILEAAIAGGKVRPLALVGIDSGPYLGSEKEYEPKKDFRSAEYLRQVNQSLFDQHLRWVVTEVMPWARTDHKLSEARDDIGLFGCSNGGAFACQAALRYPDKFGVIFSFSPGVAPQEDRVTGSLPKFYFAAGTLESYIARTKQAYDFAKKRYAETSYEEYIGGHDPNMWQIAFLDAVQKAFPPP